MFKIFKKDEKPEVKKVVPSLLACPICGKRHINQKVLDLVSKKTGISSETLIVCPECRRERTSMNLLFGISK